MRALLVAGKACLAGWQASVVDSAAGDLSNPPGGELWEPYRKLTGIRDSTAAPEITGSRARRAREFLSRSPKPAIFWPSVATFAETHLLNDPAKARKVTGVRWHRHFDRYDSAEGRVGPPESHRYARSWRLFCNLARLCEGEKPVTFRCHMFRTSDFPMLSCTEPVILPRDSTENR